MYKKRMIHVNLYQTKFKSLIEEDQLNNRDEEE